MQSEPMGGAVYFGTQRRNAHVMFQVCRNLRTRSCSKSAPVLIRLNEAAHSATTCKRGGRINQQEITPMVDTPQGGVPSADVAPMGITVSTMREACDGGAEFAGKTYSTRIGVKCDPKQTYPRISTMLFEASSCEWIIELSAAAARAMPRTSGAATCAPKCHPSWVGDGVCDPECNVDECKSDGGDRARPLHGRRHGGRCCARGASSMACRRRRRRRHQITQRRQHGNPRPDALPFLPPPPQVDDGSATRNASCNYDGVDCYNAKYNTSMCAWTARARGSPTANATPVRRATR